MWSNVISPCSSVFSSGNSPECEVGSSNDNSSPPPTRYKHATALQYDDHESTYYLYVYGGRSGTFALKDFWQLNISTGKWREIKSGSNECSDTWPPRLQEHTMVSALNRLYVFGGECHHNSDSSSHLWVWGRNEKSSECSWEKISFKNDTVEKKSAIAPVMRRGHSAVVCDLEDGTAMLIYGGYRDLKGSVGDCWAFSFGTNSWNCVTTTSSSSSQQKPGSFWTNILNYWTVSSSSSYTHLIHNNGYYACGKSPVESTGPYPPSRHNHSAVVHKSKMYVYGGMCDLTELSDFWVLDLETRRWSQIKCLYSPGILKGHAATVVGSHMYVFGGEGKGGIRTDDVWKFDFANDTFERLSFVGCRPCPRVFASASKLPLRKRGSVESPSQAEESRSSSFRKSTSVVRFADTQHLVTYSDSPGCSDYSSMETINYVENPNYRNRQPESFEMRAMGGAAPRASTQHPEYVLLIGGLETHKSAVFSKQDLVVWRLRVDCYCDGENQSPIPHHTRPPTRDRSFEVEF
ncbi:unnamed protein product [Orchesella dallaii]|uniref:Attractin/MKLN-like beta-propeller domain-containing protein n=1 Tax=Orchesella dallaii TaxID=48710 RepID=A0ABP1QX43_9HEXA